MDGIGQDARLRASEGNSFCAEGIHRHGGQRTGCVFAGREQNIELAFRGIGRDFMRELDQSSVTPAIAEITATRLQPSRCVSISRRATLRIRSGLPTEVP